MHVVAVVSYGTHVIDIILLAHVKEFNLVNFLPTFSFFNRILKFFITFFIKAPFAFEKQTVH